MVCITFARMAEEAKEDCKGETEEKREDDDEGEEDDDLVSLNN